MVVPLFSPIKNLGLDPRPVITTPVWGPEEQGVSRTFSQIYLYLISYMRHSLSYTSKRSRTTPCFRSRSYSLTNCATTAPSPLGSWHIFWDMRAPGACVPTCGATAGSTTVPYRQPQSQRTQACSTFV